MEISKPEGVLYLIRLKDVSGTERLSGLESLLGKDSRVKVRDVIVPIGAVVALFYSSDVAEELSGMGYEVIRQEKSYRVL